MNDTPTMPGHPIEEAPRHADWPHRPLLLALLGLATGLVVHLLLGNEPLYGVSPSALTLALVAAVTVTAGLVAFTIERKLWWTSIAFSAAMGVLTGLVVWWNGGPQDWSGGDGWRTVSLFLGIAIAAPLYQAARDEGRRRFPYASVHDHAWTNVVLWFACWAFVGVVFALMYLLAALFDLIKLDFLKELLERNWFWRSLIGLAFGGAVGLFREHDRVVHLLQRVLATVLAVLAPVLALGLVLFVLALPFTGLGSLWEATRATTPLLLGCIIGALILANAVIGSDDAEERRSPPLRYGAMGLALVMLPLAVIAAVATGLRIGQYGFTPDRLWGLTFVVIACAYGLVYLVSLVRGRLNWTTYVRPANLNLAFGLCGLALLLATPLVSFNAISTRDQVARLESGRTPVERFDWRALAFEFGEPGRKALERLKRSANAAIRAKATEVGAAETRSQVQQEDEKLARRDGLVGRVRILPVGTSLPVELRNLIADDDECRGPNDHEVCTLSLMPGGTEALLFENSCFAPYEKQPPSTGPGVIPSEDYCVRRYAIKEGRWQAPESRLARPPAARSAARDTGYRDGKIEVRPVQRRQVFVGGVPVGDAFE
ncbi:DUF4153 domain-containing protein [Sphingomonas sp. HF-S3]|uniref:DUF4153 domain-containing protein n=1 Tax=Sphingomonas rustica TaxID=3103142 RepID=A0ABV0BD07_9SPHN